MSSTPNGNLTTMSNVTPQGTPAGAADASQLGQKLSIGQLAKAADVSNRTLRYYEELGLIVPRTRGENRYRYYDESHLHRLQTIKMLQESGFALKEIVAALSPMLDPHGNVTPTGQDMAKKIFKALEEQRNRLIERQKDLANTIAEIQITMKSLVDCFGCKVSTDLRECAKCDKGPAEVTYLSRDLIERNAQADLVRAAPAPTQVERAFKLTSNGEEVNQTAPLKASNL